MYLQTQLPIDAVTMLVLQCLKATIPAKLSINFMITPPYTTLNCPQSEGCTEWIREDCELVTLYRGTSFPSGWNDGTIPLQLQATYRQKKNNKLRRTIRTIKSTVQNVPTDTNCEVKPGPVGMPLEWATNFYMFFKSQVHLCSLKCLIHTKVTRLESN